MRRVLQKRGFAMFNIGFGEIAVICIIMIIALGPDRLPEAMKTVGKTLRTLRQASRDIRASTGIDELMRDDIDLRSPPRPAVRKAAQIAPPEGPTLVSRGVTTGEADVAAPAESKHVESASGASSTEGAAAAPSAEGDKPRATEPTEPS